MPARAACYPGGPQQPGRQTLREFQGFTTPDDGRKFTELYNVQLLRSGQIDPVSRVCIATIQRVYSMLKGEELDPELEEFSGFDLPQREPAPVEYNPDFPSRPLTSSSPTSVTVPSTTCGGRFWSTSMPS